MLEISNLNVSYGKKEILKNISFELNKGEIFSIIGESGTGKTTLALSIMGLIKERNENVIVDGILSLDGVDINKLNKNELRKIRWNKIAMVFQNIEDAMNPVYTVIEQVKEPIFENKPFNKDKAENKALELLEMVNFPFSRINAYPHQLSLGEKQRALIAMAFALDPEVIILDEPTSSLDAISRRSIIQLLKVLCKERATLMITHDLTNAAELSDKIGVLYGGNIIELAPTRVLLSEPRHPYSRGLIRSYPDMYRTKDLQGMKGRAEFIDEGCPFHPRCTQAIEICKKKKPQLQKIGERFIACHRGGIIPLLELKGLTKRFGFFKAVDSVNLKVFEGETLAVLGQSGAGKTTLAKTIIGLLEPTDGEIFFDEKKVEEREKDFFRKVQLIYQNPREALSHRFTVLEAVREPLDIQGIGSKKERLEKVKSVLEEVELPSNEEFMKKYPHELSGGEVQRIVIARALILNPKLLIADEPTSSLDASVQAKIIKLLNNIQEKRGLGMLFITHNIPLARKISDRIAIMKSGKIIEEGSASEIFISPSNPYTKELLMN